MSRFILLILSTAPLFPQERPIVLKASTVFDGKGKTLVLTSLEPLTETSGDPAKLRELVRERKKQGADLIKLFASKSIREGGDQTMTDEQLQAACGEVKALGLRTLVHAHSASS